MFETNLLRDRATYLLAMALKAQEDGDIRQAEHLMALATEILEEIIVPEFGQPPKVQITIPRKF